jgi:hypothetical protein
MMASRGAGACLSPATPRSPEVCSVALRVLFGFYRDRARALGVAGETGSITVLQRFGSRSTSTPTSTRSCSTASTTPTAASSPCRRRPPTRSEPSSRSSRCGSSPAPCPHPRLPRRPRCPVLPASPHRPPAQAAATTGPPPPHQDPRPRPREVEDLGGAARQGVPRAGWRCPRCELPMQLRAVVWPPAARTVLTGLRASCARAPPAAVAAASP